MMSRFLLDLRKADRPHDVTSIVMISFRSELDGPPVAPLTTPAAPEDTAKTRDGGLYQTPSQHEVIQAGSAARRENHTLRSHVCALASPGPSGTWEYEIDEIDDVSMMQLYHTGSSLRLYRPPNNRGMIPVI